MKFFKLADFGEGLQEAEIVEWHVKPGDEVDMDQLLVSVETAKAIVDIPSPQKGTIARVFGSVGSTVHVGEALIEYANEVDHSGSLVGTVSTDENTQRRTAVEHNTIDATNSILATPFIRYTAKQQNIDISTLKGSGPGGQVMLSDLNRSEPSDTVYPLRGARKMMAKNMIKAHDEVVKVTIHEDADLSNWSKHNNVTARCMRALCYACKEVPLLNAWYDNSSMMLEVFRRVDMGVAVDTSDGLYVPVIRNAHQYSLEELQKQLKTFRERIASKTLPPSDMINPTITLSNFGTLCGRYADPVVVPPCVAIIGTGKIRKEVVCQNDNSIAIHPILPLSLSFDHRAVTGGEASRFLQAFINDIERDS